jgi:hypothetical protein
MREPSLGCGRWLACGAVTLALVACSDSRTAADPGITRFYAISGVDVVQDPAGNPVGVDLDGVTSTGEGPTCVDLTPDYPSVTEPGVTGVDNAFADMIVQMTDPDGAGPCTSVPDWICQRVIFDGKIAAGEWLFVIEVSGIHDGATVDDVRVAVHRAAIPGPPALIGGRLAPDQRFALEQVAETTDAVITGGRLRARFHEALPLDLPLPIPPLRDAQLSVELSPTSLRGALGGRLDVDEAAALSDPTWPGSAADIRGYYRGLVDLDPDPSDPTVCRGAALGLGIEAVSALAL